jgi:hypothetical protein
MINSYNNNDNNIMETKYTKRTNNVARHFDFTQEELSDLLYKINAFISGSVPLNIMSQDEIYDDIDLDIFLRIPYDRNNEDVYGNINKKFKNWYYPYEELAKEQISTCLKNKGYEIENINHISYGKNIDFEYRECALSHFIKNINTYKKDNKKIQIITLFDCSIDTFMETFDLDICRFVMVGTDKRCMKFYSNHITYEAECARDKVMNIYNPLYIKNLKRRIIKYINRGFTLQRKTDDMIFPIIHINKNTPNYESCVDDYICDFAEIINHEQFINSGSEKNTANNIGVKDDIYKEDFYVNAKKIICDMNNICDEIEEKKPEHDKENHYHYHYNHHHYHYNHHHYY